MILERLLLLDRNGFSFGTVWKKVGETWVCKETPESLRWMKGMSEADVLRRLDEQKGWSYQWVNASVRRTTDPEGA